MHILTSTLGYLDGNSQVGNMLNRKLIYGYLVSFDVKVYSKREWIKQSGGKLGQHQNGCLMAIDLIQLAARLSMPVTLANLLLRHLCTD